MLFMRKLSSRAPQMCNWMMLHLLQKEAFYLCRQAESQPIRSAHRLSLLSGGLQSCWPGIAGDCVRARHAIRARCGCLWCRTTQGTACCCDETFARHVQKRVHQMCPPTVYTTTEESMWKQLCLQSIWCALQTLCMLQCVCRDAW